MNDFEFTRRAMRCQRAARLPGTLALCAAMASGQVAVSTPAVAATAEPVMVLAAADVSGRRAPATQRLWVIRDQSEIRLVPREAGVVPNQHPAALEPEWLRRQLIDITFDDGGRRRALFDADEAAELAVPLAEALGQAGPQEDLLLVSSARRGEVRMMQPIAVTARLFVAEGRLQLIVRDTRFEFYNAMRGSNRTPEFSYGSRSKQGAAVLRHARATEVRGDWLALPLAAPAAAAPAAVTPAAVAIPAVAVPAGAALPALAPAAAAAPAPPAARDAAFYEQQEQRLKGLKRLREQGLIDETEYQNKRREILNSL
ncbi:SHOCT domain-containing protein [Rubrivivax sp. A210]|uniref:SHOCT domain-containing protein n=1 Tax=Rubrivivax sp. A210 TaxID=2772301 RepID=UPI00191B38B9|nr:SHOCT domain-containing protein [Rubrivivax sp. A210]CAD5366226.1 SHOCT domain-containing protein [Rubrivivax sp. A210]